MATSGFVYVIESPSAQDLLDGRTEGNSLCSALTLAEIPRWYSLITNKDTLSTALGDRLWAAWRHHQLRPVLHLSMHGNERGVGLTSGEFISWEELRHWLQPLKTAMDGDLLICMSACFGASGCRMAMNTAAEKTFWALVGNAGKPSWPEAAVAYTTFYHLFFKGLTIDQCVAAMNQASGCGGFMVTAGRQMKSHWAQMMTAHQQSQLGEALLGASQAARPR